jgi:hypothetical protein
MKGIFILLFGGILASAVVFLCMQSDLKSHSTANKYSHSTQKLVYNLN